MTAMSALKHLKQLSMHLAEGVAEQSLDKLNSKVKTEAYFLRLSQCCIGWGKELRSRPLGHVAVHLKHRNPPSTGAACECVNLQIAKETNETFVAICSFALFCGSVCVWNLSWSRTTAASLESRASCVMCTQVNLKRRQEGREVAGWQ
jgi:hypothetical protein